MFLRQKLKLRRWCTSPSPSCVICLNCRDKLMPQDKVMNDFWSNVRKGPSLWGFSATHYCSLGPCQWEKMMHGRKLNTLGRITSLFMYGAQGSSPSCYYVSLATLWCRGIKYRTPFDEYTLFPMHPVIFLLRIINTKRKNGVIFLT